MSATWGRLQGRTDVFAVDLHLMDDPDATDLVDPDEVASWGTFQLWANGRNFTLHTEAGVQLESCHWYLLPLCEWLVENWDDLLHEERLPGPDVKDAATGIERLSQQHLLSEAREDELDEQVRDWWQSHNLAVGCMGAAFPPTFLRRWGDLIEVSQAGRSRSGIPSHVRYVGNDVERVEVGSVGPVLWEILQALAHELARRRPESERVALLRRKVDDLQSIDRQSARRAEMSQGLMPASVDAGVVVLRTPVAGLLFGCMEPTVSPEDVMAVHELLARHGGSSPQITNVQVPDSSVVAGLEPGPAGSILGEDAWELLAISSDAPVDVEGLIQSLGVRLETVKLSDKNIRSLCVLGEGMAVVAVNPNYRSGDAKAVQRFSMAHELCHLLFDRERAVSVAVASGPWAPQGLERQANAFAAAFLMPADLVQRVLAEVPEPSPRLCVEAVAQALVVPFTSAMDRLRNLGVLSDAEADELKQR